MSVNQHKEAQMTNKQLLQWLHNQFWEDYALLLFVGSSIFDRAVYFLIRGASLPQVVIYNFHFLVKLANCSSHLASRA